MLEGCPPEGGLQTSDATGTVAAAKKKATAIGRL